MLICVPLNGNVKKKMSFKYLKKMQKIILACLLEHSTLRNRTSIMYSVNKKVYLIIINVAKLYIH